MDETAVHNLLRLVGKQPTHLKLLGILVPLVSMAFVGFVVYQIWKLFRKEEDCSSNVPARAFFALYDKPRAVDQCVGQNDNHNGH